jgi:hypothetical protein
MNESKLAEALRLGIEALTCAGSHAECQSLEVYAKEQMRQALASYEAEPAVQVVVERERVWVKRGVQSFMLAYEAETDAEREWYAGQLRAALSNFTPDVKTEAKPAPADDREERPDFLAFNPAYQKAAERFAELHAEPVAWLNYKVTLDERGDEAKRTAELDLKRLAYGYAWSDAVPLVRMTAAPAAPAPEPLTQAQRIRLWNNCPEVHGDVVGRDAFERLVKLVESVHQIGIAASKESGNGQ